MIYLKILFPLLFILCVQRDVTGIGGSWSDFLDYVLASIKSDDVKLVLEGDSVGSFYIATSPLFYCLFRFS